MIQTPFWFQVETHISLNMQQKQTREENGLEVFRALLDLQLLLEIKLQCGRMEGTGCPTWIDTNNFLLQYQSMQDTLQVDGGIWYIKSDDEKITLASSIRGSRFLDCTQSIKDALYLVFPISDITYKPRKSWIVTGCS